MPFLYGVLSLFDDTIRAMLSIPLFSFFLGGMLTFAALGLFLMLKDAASGQERRR
ncbi:hypothetical protein [Oscillibacter sp.]|uniref:hypothetical protein n=1 Tax=Oscillibacter sp. TaxID=1945593 RepID=UPI002D7EE7CB|nr:hypothetical protein [Oscillibacter sp.]